MCVSTPVSKEFDHIKERNCLSFDSDFSVHLYSAGGCPTPEERASNKEALQDVLISARTLADVPASILKFRLCCSQAVTPILLVKCYCLCSNKTILPTQHSFGFASQGLAST